MIRPASRADLRAIVAVQSLAGRSTSDAFQHDLLIALAPDSGRVLLVAEIDGGVAGWGTTSRYAEADGAAPAGEYLSGLTVAPLYRRRGLGLALVIARLDVLRERASRAYCTVNARNDASLALHRKVGFAEVDRGARFRGIEFDGGEGVLLAASLESPLPSAPEGAAGRPRGMP